MNSLFVSILLFCPSKPPLPQVAATDLATMGIKVISYTINEVTDDQGKLLTACTSHFIGSRTIISGFYGHLKTFAPKSISSFKCDHLDRVLGFLKSICK